MDIIILREYCISKKGATESFPFGERYPTVTPGYHMNKKHWNTVLLDGSVPDKEVFSWIDHSYNLIK